MALTRPLSNRLPLKHCCETVSSGMGIVPGRGHEVHQVVRSQLSELHLSPASELHVHSSSRHPPLVPPNIDELNSSARCQFSRRRSRDISGRLALLSGGSLSVGHLVDPLAPAPDTHLQSYDCRGAVSLHSVMQTNVPEPFAVELAGRAVEELLMPGGPPTHLNMPGGQCGQEDKYLARDLQEAHPRRLPRH
ncbi:uncharacterized protein LOC119105833 [Pollicipes pollicipes]|uniref:uncharacterized protein LOC119105833 n=1 Tax=Pollicipes pollicipes TaxID=41117 RepID=UPI0018852789|nr:uncharacterized protein LOC119105833 [Pollicipes pollicipes]XP_037085274.1 uncharacterized protein LOC119105833 [Pollicipes pollicipes]XP_037085275.1 uncharacterized protein LOC119105833 [Pollicipes pollicipes]XP_037085276.1 uncharacterized protein LOC119105833 [Pollicipes pollicipes]